MKEGDGNDMYGADPAESQIVKEKGEESRQSDWVSGLREKNQIYLNRKTGSLYAPKYQSPSFNFFLHCVTAFFIFGNSNASSAPADALYTQNVLYCIRKNIYIKYQTSDKVRMHLNQSLIDILDIDQQLEIH